MALTVAGCTTSPSDIRLDGGHLDAGARPDSSRLDGTTTLCAADSECDDGSFCNGVEVCMIGLPGAGADGCLAGSPPCDADAGESCDEASNTCVAGGCDAGNADLDGDGDDRIECGGSDCDDSDANVYGTAQEVCDAAGVDEDCDPSTIQDTTTNDGDRDGDGFVSVVCFNPIPTGGERRGDDCDDARPTINVDGVEACDGRDNDCDGRVDEDVLEVFYRDVDGDGFGDDAALMMDCTAAPGWVLTSGDCADRDASIHPGATELCDGVDNDCSGTVDDPSAGCGCTSGDVRDCGPLERLAGVGVCRRSSQTCVSGRWPEECPGAVYPRVDGSSVPYDPCGLGDEDCDGSTDEDGLLPFFLDMDRDGYGTRSMRTDYCPGDEPSTYVSNGDDCDDGDSSVNPAAVEVCDGIDNDCVGGVDDVTPMCVGDCRLGMTQACGTDEGDCVAGTQSCTAAGTWGPCSDIGPSWPFERCGGGDEDCDGRTDDADPDIQNRSLATGAADYWRDRDGDTWGTNTDVVRSCLVPGGYVAPRVQSDCDDNEAMANPGYTSEASFTCDSINNDCDGETDEEGSDALLCFEDGDMDGYGRMYGGVSVCGACPAGRVANDRDCRDMDASVHPSIRGYPTVGLCPGGAAMVRCSIAGVVRYRCGICPGTEPFWDYDCDGVVEPQLLGVKCVRRGRGCTGTRGLIAPATAADCGLDAMHRGGCAPDCSNLPDAVEPIGCR